MSYFPAMIYLPRSMTLISNHPSWWPTISSYRFFQLYRRFVEIEPDDVGAVHSIFDRGFAVASSYISREL
jgi:hypothetical protein